MPNGESCTCFVDLDKVFDNVGTVSSVEIGNEEEKHTIHIG